MNIDFVIPVRHPSMVKDKGLQLDIMAQTFASLAAQTADGWSAIVVANKGDVLPELPLGFRVEWVDYPPAAGYDDVDSLNDYYAAVRQDKGRRVLAAARTIDPRDYMMVVDDDDLLSNRLVDFVRRQPERNGWVINLGYAWVAEQNMLRKVNDFHTSCGTSLIIRADFFRFAEQTPGEEDDAAIEELGSHKIVVKRASAAGTPFEFIPFPAGIYRYNHPNATQREIKERGLKSRWAILGPLRRIARRMRRNLRGSPAPTQSGSVPITQEIREEFFGRPGG
ncbi:MAG: hypothetical protein V2I43_00480 [Parvularcula sp.]|jgi:hypothetical protein|nr:hypothetical protein [Parvularcula sp.]